jgi:hypothetical protein
VEPPAISVVTGHTVPGGAGVATQLPDNACRTVFIRALGANAGAVWVGGAGVTNANGVPLYAKDGIPISVDNTNMLYVNADNAGDGVAWLVLD